MKLIDRTGQRFGRLVVLRRTSRLGGTAPRRTWWLCRCDCGRECTVVADVLCAGTTRSCGCLHREVTGRLNLTHGHAVGYRRTPEIRAWNHAKGRCYNPTDAKYPQYGGRGITMCERWLESSSAFLKDMGPRPPGTTLDRIDVDGPYSPSNCRWATAAVQATNQRKTVRADWKGATVALSDVARMERIDYKSLYHFHRSRGLPLAEAVSRARPLR